MQQLIYRLHLKFMIDTFRKRTRQWNIHHLKMNFLLKMVTFNVMLFFQGVPKIATIISSIHSLNFQGESLTPLLEFFEITQWCPLSAIQLMIFLPKFFSPLCLIGIPSASICFQIFSISLLFQIFPSKMFPSVSSPSKCWTPSAYPPWN